MESAWFRRMDKSKAEGMENFLQLAADAEQTYNTRINTLILTGANKRLPQLRPKGKFAFYIRDTENK